MIRSKGLSAQARSGGVVLRASVLVLYYEGYRTPQRPSLVRQA